jgi:L-galactose dehydrogenase/L-glyceraldehyde 3-phosphate reductase
MQLRPLGSTGQRVSALAFGAGPVPATMTSDDPGAQVAVVARAIERGINWFDTAAGYGQGKSESALGAALRHLGASDRVHIATKVRLAEDQRGDIPRAVRASLESSLSRLGVPRVTLLQLHNSITARRDDEPTSLTPADVLGSGGVLEALEQLRRHGLVGHIGLTGIGQAESLREVIRSGQFQTLQIPYNLLNPSAGRRVPTPFTDTNYGNVIADCAERGMGVFAIRVLAGGALADNPPSAHTLKTPFFPVALYERDRGRARELARILPSGMPATEAAVRFAVSHAGISSAIVGFSTPSQVDDAVEWAGRGPLPDSLLAAVLDTKAQP